MCAKNSTDRRQIGPISDALSFWLLTEKSHETIKVSEVYEQYNNI